MNPLTMLRTNHDERERRLNTHILNITMLIMDKYPELSKYIEEMPITIPSDNKPEITLKKLQDYFDSLCLVVHDYKLERSSLGN